jgi:hypothetical protein
MRGAQWTQELPEGKRKNACRFALVTAPAGG